MKKPNKKPENTIPENVGIRLNKFLSNSGIASRRKADELIEKGYVKVNGKVITEMGYKVMPRDKVFYRDKQVLPGRKVYVLLNKPKDYITTTSDERGRKTVLDLIRFSSDERIYPVGRLDRNTTGLLLLTNDGELAQALSHPSGGVKKTYAVTLDKPVKIEDMKKILDGLNLEDGLAQVDEIEYSDLPDKSKVGITIHIGKNRIVRRIFEHLGYKVKYLDRVTYAGLTKKDLPRGKWRHLNQKEIIMLKHFRRNQ